MSVAAKIYPAISINQFADPVSFVRSWNRLFDYDEKYEEYTALRDKKELTAEDWWKLFMWFEGKKLSPKKSETFKREISGKLAILNAMKSEVDIGDLYVEFGQLEHFWFSFLAHVLINNPLFNRDIYRAYYFINNAEIREFPEEEGEQMTEYLNYIDFFDNFADLTPECGIEELEVALWVFGQYLHKHSVLFLP